MIIAPPFWSGFDAGRLTPGTPTPSAIAINAATPAICKIDATRALLIYQNTTPFYLAAVVVSVSGSTVSFGTPVTISAAVRVPWSVRPLGSGGDGDYVAFSRGTSVAAARVISVSGTTITTPNAEATAALTAPNRGYGEVLSTTQLGVVFEDTVAAVQKVYGIAATVAAGVVTFGTAAISTMFSLAGGGSRPVLRSGELVQWGRDVSGSPAYLAAVGFTVSGTTCTPSTMYLPTLTDDRIRVDSTYGSGGTIDVGGGVMALLYQDQGTSSVASVRGAWSGSAATYSNSDTNKNILPGSPYPPPAASKIQSYGQVAPSPTYGTYMIASGGVISMYSVGISGTINMAGAVVDIVPSGASNLRPGHVYLSATQILYVYVQSAGVLLGAGVCAVG